SRASWFSRSRSRNPARCASEATEKTWPICRPSSATAWCSRASASVGRPAAAVAIARFPTPRPNSRSSSPKPPPSNSTHGNLPPLPVQPGRVVQALGDVRVVLPQDPALDVQGPEDEGLGVGGAARLAVDGCQVVQGLGEAGVVVPQGAAVDLQDLAEEGLG